MPTDAQNEPKPANPFCFAPQGTASIFSNRPRSGWFLFLTPALTGTATTMAIARMIRVFVAITPPHENSLAFLRLRFPTDELRCPPAEKSQFRLPAGGRQRC